MKLEGLGVLENIRRQEGACVGAYVAQGCNAIKASRIRKKQEDSIERDWVSRRRT